MIFFYSLAWRSPPPETREIFNLGCLTSLVSCGSSSDRDVVRKKTLKSFIYKALRRITTKAVSTETLEAELS